MKKLTNEQREKRRNECEHRDSREYLRTSEYIGGSEVFVSHLECGRCGLMFGKIEPRRTEE